MFSSPRKSLKDLKPMRQNFIDTKNYHQNYKSPTSNSRLTIRCPSKQNSQVQVSSLQSPHWRIRNDNSREKQLSPSLSPKFQLQMALFNDQILVIVQQLKKQKVLRRKLSDKPSVASIIKKSKNFGNNSNSSSYVEDTINKTKFRFIYVLGKGGFGKVWKVELYKNHKQYALKEMSKARILTKRSVNSVMNERLLLTKLRFQFMSNIQFSFQDRINLYLVMDLLSGGDLRYHICINKTFTEWQTKFIISCLLLCLEYLEKNQILHRDIKPENIVLDKEGYPKLTDFGIARMMKSENFQETSGTPGYMGFVIAQYMLAPEVMCHQNHGYGVDHFALGVMIHEFMTGKRPYIGKSRKEIKDAMLTKQVSIKKQDYWSYESADICNLLLQRKPQYRLGYKGIIEIKQHPWLKDMDWDKLLEMEIPSPFKDQAYQEDQDFRRQISSDHDSQNDLIQENLAKLKEEDTQALFSNYEYFNALNLSQSLSKFEMVTSLAFKYEFLIEALSSLLQLLDNQLLSIFIMQEEKIITFLRNHPSQNKELIGQLLQDYIQAFYSQKQVQQRKTIQQGIESTITQLRCYGEPYNIKKYIILSDFTNFEHNKIYTFDLWDTQGYIFSLDAIIINSLTITGYEQCKTIIDVNLIREYMQHMNGDIYDINLKNQAGKLIDLTKINEIFQPKIYEFRYKLTLGSYEVKYPQELLNDRIKEGFKIKDKNNTTLTFQINHFTYINYQYENSQITISCERQYEFRRRSFDLNDESEKEYKKIFENYKLRDYLQEIIISYNNKSLSLEDTLNEIVKHNAFENQKFVNRNFKQISLVFIIRSINFRLYQEDGEEFNKQKFYQYIRQKIQEVATKSLQNYLLYQNGNDFVIIRLLWHSHSILRLVCIYNNDEMLTKVKIRIKELFKSNQILRNTLIEYDHTIKNLLISSETHELKKNPQVHFLELSWEWPQHIIWDLQQMYKILLSLRAKSDFIGVPSLGDRTNKFFVTQLMYNEEPIIIVQNIILFEKSIYVNCFTENIIKDVRTIIIEYFQKFKEFERQIIITLHSLHSAYRQALMKKQNNSRIDFFMLQFTQRQKSRDQIVISFREQAQTQISNYPLPTDQTNYALLIEKAYAYQEIKQQYLENSQKSNLFSSYKQINQQMCEFNYVNNNLYLYFLVIAPLKMLMIHLQENQTVFYLLSLEQIERGNNSHDFLNTQQEKKIDILINYVQQEYNQAFAKEVHSLFVNNIKVKELDTAIEGCQKIMLDFDFTNVQQCIRSLFDLQPKKSMKKSLIDESPVKQLKRSIQPRIIDVKQQFVTQQCTLWNERLNKMMLEGKISMIHITDDWYYYDNRQERTLQNQNILFMKKVLREGDTEYSDLNILFDYQRIKKSRTKILIQYIVYFYEARSFNKLVNNDVELDDGNKLNQSEEPTSVSIRIQRWSDLLKKYNHQFLKRFELSIRRLLPINDENIQLIYSLVETMDNKQIEMSLTDKKFDQAFQAQFADEMKYTSELNNLHRFININNQYYIFVLTLENCNISLFDQFELEKESLIEEQYVVPFWFIIHNENNKLEIIWQSDVDISNIIQQLIELIKQTIEVTNLYLITRLAIDDSKNEIKLITKEQFEIDAETPVEKPPPLQKQTTTNKLWKNVIPIEQKVQEQKECNIPFVGFRVLYPFQNKKLLIQSLIANTILMNHQIKNNLYSGFLDKQIYLFMFQIVKQVSQYSEKYPFLAKDALPGQMAVIMSVYSTNRNNEKIQKDIDIFYEHIKRKIDEDITSILSQSIVKNPRLKEQEYYQLLKGERNYMSIKLNQNIKDMLAYSIFFRQNLEKVLFKYEVLTLEKNRNDIISNTEYKYQVDQHENSFMYSRFKYQTQNGGDMGNIFGQGVSLVNFFFQANDCIITSFQFSEQPKYVKQDSIFAINDTLPELTFNSGQKNRSQEICYNIENNYQSKELIIEFTSRGQLEWENWKEFFQILVKQVELEYCLEITQRQDCNLETIENIFRQLKNYSFKMHHIVLPLQYEEILWKDILKWIQQKINNELKQKGVWQSEQFELIFNIDNNNPFESQKLGYLIQEHRDSDNYSLDVIKNQASQKIKNNLADLYQRSIIFYINLSSTLEVFLYNVNLDIVSNLNCQLTLLSKWSIIRSKVAQKIKNDLIGGYNIKLSSSVEEEFQRRHRVYHYSVVNELHRLRTLENRSKTKNEQTIFKSTSQALEYIIDNPLPIIEKYQEFEVHLENFFKINLTLLKPKKLILQELDEEKSFLQREGRAYLNLLKEFYKNTMQNQLILFVKKYQQSKDSQIEQDRIIIDKILNQGKIINNKALPLYLFLSNDRHPIKGILDQQKEYNLKILEAYNRVLQQPGYEILFIEEYDIDSLSLEQKQTFLQLTQEEGNALIYSINLEAYFKGMNLQLENQNMSKEKRVNYLRSKSNPSILKIIVLYSQFIFERTYCLPDQEINIIDDSDWVFKELEQYHLEMIDEQWFKNFGENNRLFPLINLSLLINGYNQYYFSYKIQSIPRLESVLFQINVNFIFDKIEIQEFLKYITQSSNIFYLEKIQNFYTFSQPMLSSKSQQLQTYILINLLSQLQSVNVQRSIELELDEQQQGSKQLQLIIHFLINTDNSDFEKFLQFIEEILIETLKRALKNFLANSLWKRMSISTHLQEQDLAFLTQYCQQIQTKKLAKEIKFEQLNDDYKQKEFNIEDFLSRIGRLKYIYNQKTVLLVNQAQDVLYIIDVQDNHIYNTRILYLIMDNPQYDQEKMIKPHHDECTQLINKFIAEK